MKHIGNKSNPFSVNLYKRKRDFIRVKAFRLNSLRKDKKLIGNTKPVYRLKQMFSRIFLIRYPWHLAEKDSFIKGCRKSAALMEKGAKFPNHWKTC